MTYVGFSGGKDSTALVLRMAELGEEFEMLFNPTGNELPDLIGHIRNVVGIVGRKLHLVSCGESLQQMIVRQNALPSFRMRWCTRTLKIEPTIKFLTERPGSVLCVGLRADEEERKGLYSELVKSRFPFQEWGWRLPQIMEYNHQRGVTVPERTDCALCYDQRLAEWWRLWKNHPDQWARGEEFEAMTGHTFRSTQRDTWPAAMKDLRARFEAGDIPKERKKSLAMEETKCRVCSL